MFRQPSHPSSRACSRRTRPSGRRLRVKYWRRSMTSGDSTPPNVVRRRARIGVVVAALGVLAAVAVGAWLKMHAGTAVADDADVIAVMPLATTGDSALARLGRDLVVTLSANLDG